MKRIAQCSCGAVKLVVTGDPNFVVACHCLDCQRRTGSVLGVGAYFPLNLVAASGLTREFVRPNETWNHFHFCPVCGTTTHWFSDKEPTLLGIAVGAFAEPSIYPPVRSVWEQSKHNWVEIDANQHFPKSRHD